MLNINEITYGSNLANKKGEIIEVLSDLFEVIFYNPADYHGIPLTEDLLQKMGFEIIENPYETAGKRYKYRTIEITFRMGKFKFFYVNGIRHLQFVHQVQQLASTLLNEFKTLPQPL